MSPQRDVYAIFQFGGLTAALPRESVLEILPVPDLTHPPTAPRALAGVFNLSGEAVATVSLAALFGGEAQADLYSHLLLVRSGDRRLALLVDRVLDVTPIDPQTLRAADEGESLNGCVVAQLARADGLVPVLSLERLLLAEEKARLADITQAAQARIEEWSPSPA
ncbi:chemotaxis protein CheW [Caulobacter sp. NIBR2454]|uniref:chemotaxis protein CheW n=1 Tax=Caulobacter sp. NIBR2454 TaxID=3015996 RepID=UPI0022B6922B|nr:chemotaxis protein CheW [Caulobacter sp. NIBR2454]